MCSIQMEKPGSARVIHTHEQSPEQGASLILRKLGGFPLLLGSTRLRHAVEALPTPSHRQTGPML